VVWSLTDIVLTNITVEGRDHTRMRGNYCWKYKAGMNHSHGQEEVQVIVVSYTPHRTIEVPSAQ
jgi:hypothetical protein